MLPGYCLSASHTPTGVAPVCGTRIQCVLMMIDVSGNDGTSPCRLLRVCCRYNLFFRMCVYASRLYSTNAAGLRRCACSDGNCVQAASNSAGGSMGRSNRTRRERSMSLGAKASLVSYHVSHLATSFSWEGFVISE